ncbi:MAG TPA: type II secretion system protein [Candidatus Saccharibacteria bacterium]|nr:type II secretion system protein [Candidatus Saccharibacteria bacterium]
MIISMRHSGFSIIELIIVVTIMSILLVLGTGNLKGSMSKADDAERKADTESIAMSLETFYTSGTNGSTSFGFYPSTEKVGILSDASGCTIDTTLFVLRDINPKSLEVPGNNNETACDLWRATNNSQTTTSVLPQPTESKYVYQPLDDNNELCNSTNLRCRKYNLYYYLTSTNTTYKIKSKNQ